MSLPDVETVVSADTYTDTAAATDIATDTEAAPGESLESGTAPQGADGESTQPPTVRSLPRRFGIAALYLAIAVALFATYLRISDTFPMVSDGANNALQGWDLLHGHLLLHGWIIGDATYYTLELPLFALTEAVTGLNSSTTHVVAALTCLIVVIAAAALARGEARGAQAVMRYIVVVGILAVPLRNLGATSVIDSNPEHFGTGAILLLAFLLIERRAQHWLTPFLLAALLVAGEVGDATVLYVGALPIVLVGTYRVLATRKVFSLNTAIVLAAAASYPLTHLARRVMRHFGGYTMVLPHTELAPAHRWMHNAHLVYRDILIDFGHDRSMEPHDFTTTLGFILCMAAMLSGLAGLLWVLLRWFRASWGEQLVVTAIVVNLGAFAVSAVIATDNAREIIFVVAGSAVLAARMVGPKLASRRTVMAGLAVAGVVPLVMGLERPVATTYTPDLTQFLEDHHLSYGISEYTDASSVSLQSGGKVQVRAVDHAGTQYAGYSWETRADWYDPAKYDATFFIADPTDARDQVAPADVEKVYGAPDELYTVQGRVVLVYNFNLLDKVYPAHRAKG